MPVWSLWNLGIKNLFLSHLLDVAAFCLTIEIYETIETEEKYEKQSL